MSSKKRNPQHSTADDAATLSLGNFLPALAGIVRTIAESQPNALVAPPTGNLLPALAGIVRTIAESQPNALVVPPTAIAAPEPEGSDDGIDELPTQLWSYCEGEWHNDIPYVPSGRDRMTLERARRPVWDFFFQIDRDHVGRPHERRIRRLQGRLADLSRQIAETRAAAQRATTVARQAAKGARDTAAEKARSAERRRTQIDDLERRVEAIEQQIVLERREQHARRQGLMGVATALLRPTSGWLADPSEAKIERLREEEEHLTQERDMLWRVDAALDDDEEHGKDEDHREEVRRCAEQLRELEQNVGDIEHAISVLAKARDRLRTQVPRRPPVSVVDRMLASDLERVIDWSQDRIATGTDLLEAVVIDPITLESAASVENPLITVSPASAQDPAKIPFGYLPPNLNVLEMLYRSGTNLADVVRLVPVLTNWEERLRGMLPGPAPDCAKHFQAQRVVDGKTYHGMYFVSMVYFGKSRLVAHECFLDFIRGEIVGEQATEVYYDDVVALRRRGRTRWMLASARTDAGPRIMEDVPVVELELRSGTSLSVTLVTEEGTAAGAKSLQPAALLAALRAQIRQAKM